eukprot:scaffold23498_cov159-Cylindrotheca_fusiformis.AAC.3
MWSTLVSATSSHSPPILPPCPGWMSRCWIAWYMARRPKRMPTIRLKSASNRCMTRSFSRLMFPGSLYIMTLITLVQRSSAYPLRVA